MIFSETKRKASRPSKEFSFDEERPTSFVFECYFECNRNIIREKVLEHYLYLYHLWQTHITTSILSCLHSHTTHVLSYSECNQNYVEDCTRSHGRCVHRWARVTNRYRELLDVTQSFHNTWTVTPIGGVIQCSNWWHLSHDQDPIYYSTLLH